MTMAMVALLVLLSPQLVYSDTLSFEGNSIAESTSDLYFPQAVHTLSVEIREPECKKACRIWLCGAKSTPDNHLLLEETSPSPTVIFTGLKTGSYYVRANCSDAAAVCQPEPVMVPFRVMNEVPSGVISVGKLTLTVKNAVVQAKKVTRWRISKDWQIVAIVVVLVVQWIGLRHITSRCCRFRRPRSRNYHVASLQQIAHSCHSHAWQVVVGFSRVRSMESSRLLEKIKLHAALVIHQLGFAGFEILTRNLLIAGFSPFVFPVYRNAIAFVVLAPAAYILERKERPRMELHHLPMFLSTGTIGIFFNQVTYILGLRYTSASFTSAYRNSLPVFTFILASALGLEKIAVRKRHGQAKILGTSLGVLGALIMSLYRGPEVVKPPAVGNLLPLEGSHDHLFHGFHLSTWHVGVVILTAAFFSFSVFLILQTQLMKTYPAPLSIASISIAIGGIQLAALALIVEPEMSRWELTSPSTIIAVVYAGLIASGLVSAIQSWGVKKAGPVIVASYQPLETVAVAILGFIFLKEALHLGSLLGAFLVVMGLYLLIWGQAVEKKEMQSILAQPLLPKVVSP